ncbi:MAG: hypothetical protein MK479_05515, partial [Planctomycetes bacterium]|nr:hypothetical protein [Planctomycetota bacterium]
MYQYFLSLRFFRSRFLTLAAFLSTMFGVAMLLIVQSVMGGYMSQLKENIRGQEAHLRILGRNGPLGIKDFTDLEKAIKTVAKVRETAPYIERLAVYRSGVSIKPTMLAGVDPVRQAGVSDFASYMLRPEELGVLLDKHLPPPSPSEDDDVEREELNMPQAMSDLHSILSLKDRAPLSAAELQNFFDLQWRRKILQKHNPLLAAEFPIPPAGLIVGVESILQRRVMLGQILTVITLSPDTGREISERFLITGAINTGDFQLDSGTLFADVQKVRNLLNKDLGELQSPYRYQGIRIALNEKKVDVTNPVELEKAR